ncbi:hypothetical protein CXP52_07605 [Bacillus paralicheniformis]|nr:hypothetical protein CXP52_22705 [Bacillus paralicheniformis]TAI52218.1 hypothetical protein CXP52_07605 [Bacillus paralicheniformis]
MLTVTFKFIHKINRNGIGKIESSRFLKKGDFESVLGFGFQDNESLINRFFFLNILERHEIYKKKK